VLEDSSLNFDKLEIGRTSVTKTEIDMSGFGQMNKIEYYSMLRGWLELRKRQQQEQVWFWGENKTDQHTTNLIMQKICCSLNLQGSVMRVAVPIPAVASASVFHSAAGGSVVDVVRPL